MNPKKPPTGYDSLWKMLQTVPCYKTKQGQHLVEVKINNRNELFQVGSEDFKHWAIYQLNRIGKRISAEGMQQIIARLNAKVWALDKQIEVYTRIGRTKRAIYYNLSNADGEVIRITKDGYSTERSVKCPVKFLRSGNMMEQVKPIKNEDITIFDLKKYFNIKSEKDMNLMLVYLVSCFVPQIAHPILISVGSQGASKTTSNVLIKKIVDPALADIVSLPREKRDLIIQLNRGYMLFYDNIKKINQDFNDIFCQASTGGYQIARKLYTDDDIIAYKLQRCLLLNGITDLTDQPDLLDRAVSIKYERIDDAKRISERELYANFNRDLPFILNDIFNVLSQALCIIEDVKLDNLPRMADFARWGYAIAEVLEIGGDNFIRDYKENQLGIGLELLQSNITATAIIAFAKQKKSWSGSVMQFWELLEAFAIQKNISTSDPTWAKSANSLSRKMAEMKVNLELQGVHFTKQNIGSCKELHIWTA